MTSPPSIRASLGLDWPTACKAGSLALAAWLSFAVAGLLHVHNAYWAAMPVWVLTQPSRGLVLERAVFRVIGTLIGAGVGFALVHIPAPPLLQLALLALWIAASAGLTHVMRGVTGYAAQLAGMTAAIVVIPSVFTPVESMAIAVARVECTLIGVVVSTLVLALLTPSSPLAEFYAQIRAVSAEAVAYAARVLREGMVADGGKEERRILGLISTLESTARLTAAGSVEGYRRMGDVDLLVVGSLSTMAAAQAIRVGGGACDASLPAQLERVANHLHTAWDSPIVAAERRLDSQGDARLERLQVAVGQILDADLALNRSPATLAPSPAPGSAWLAPHREWPLAWRTGAMAGAASFIASFLGLWLDWPPIQLAAMGVCIFVTVLGSLPLPQLVAPKLFTGVVVGALTAVFYRLTVQPTITTTSELLLSLVPFLLVGGFARAHPRTAAPAIDANMCFLLASQVGMPATSDVAAIVSDASALGLAAAVIAGPFILRPRRTERQAMDAAAVIRRDLQRILEAGTASDAVDWHARGARQILRLTLHLGRARELGARWPAGLLAALNLGQAMIDLQQQGMPEVVKVLLAALLQQRMSPRETALALQAVADAETHAGRRQAIAGLAATLFLAADLLSFGLPANAARRN